MPGTFAKTLAAATPGSGYWTPPEYISRCFSTDTRWCSNRSLTLSVLMVPDTPVCGHAVMLCMCSGTVAHADSSNVGWQRTPGYCRFPSCGFGCTHPPCKKSCGAAQVWKDKRLCKNPQFDGRCSQLSASSQPTGYSVLDTTMAQRELYLSFRAAELFCGAGPLALHRRQTQPRDLRRTLPQHRGLCGVRY